MAEPQSIDQSQSQQTNSPLQAVEGWFAKKPWLLALILVAATFAAYSPVWRAGFVWDDDDHLTANPAMTAPHGLRMIWSSLAVSRYYPLTLTTFWVERRLWGLHHMPYHMVNIAFHALSGILLYFVLRRMRVPGAWLGALLWVLHPVNVESVAWVTEMKNTQSGVFFFLAVLCFLEFIEGEEKPRWYVLTLLCGLAAVLSKPSTVVLPVVLLLCAWRQRGVWRWADALRMIPLFALALWASGRAIIEQHGQIAIEGSNEWKLGIAERLIIAGKAVWFYALHLLWPVKLMFAYPRWQVQANSLTSWLPLAGLVIGAVLLCVSWRKPWAQAVLLGLGGFVVALLPVLGFFDVYYFRYSFVADHFQYLASSALLALMGGAGGWLYDQGNWRTRQMVTVVATAILVILAVLTWRHARAFHDPETLWRDTLAKNPDAWMAHNNLGAILKQTSGVASATNEFQQALQLNPDDANARMNLGIALIEQGKIREAIPHLEEAVRIKPDSTIAHNSLGVALLNAGRTEDATAQLEQTLELDPNDVDAHYNLGIILLQANKIPDAIGHLEQAVSGKPNSADFQFKLALALKRAGRVDDAIDHYEEALRIAPTNANMRINLGNALLQAGKVPDAITQYEQALEIAPDSAMGHYNLGNALAQAGRTDEAIKQYEDALRLKPDFKEATQQLARLRATP